MSINEVISESAFWQFSSDFYGVASNKEALLRLQDDSELNVNIMLLILFLGQQGYVLEQAQVKKLQEDITELDSLTSHIREARRQAKRLFSEPKASNIDNAEYEGLLSVELSLEKRQQAQLVLSLIGIGEIKQRASAIDDCLLSLMNMVNSDIKTTLLAKKEFEYLLTNLRNSVSLDTKSENL